MGRVFSGIQPTGEIHLGNYIGALLRFVTSQDVDDCVFCIVDLHGLTETVPDPDDLRAKTLDLAAIYLAAGIDGVTSGRSREPSPMRGTHRGISYACGLPRSPNGI